MSIDESLRSAAQLSDRVAELRAWAASRIAWCSATESNCAPLDDDESANLLFRSAQVERRALMAVLAILNGKETPR